MRGGVTIDDVPDVKLDGVRLFDHDDSLRESAARRDLRRLTGDRAASVRRDRPRDRRREPHVVTAEQALAADASEHAKPTGTITAASPRVDSRGDVDAGLRDADVTITREYRTPVALHTALEPHGAVAEWIGGHAHDLGIDAGHLHDARAKSRRRSAFRSRRSRVIKNYMGGGFGAKNGAPHSTYIAAALAKKTGRPVRCILDREGEQTDAGNRTATTQRVTLGAKRDGTLTAISVDVTIALGVGGWLASPAQDLSRAVSSARTCAAARRSSSRTRRRWRRSARRGTSKARLDSSARWTSLARELGIDPLELRRRNYATRDQDKGRAYSDKRLDECYRHGRRAVRVGERAQSRREQCGQRFAAASEWRR